MISPDLYFRDVLAFMCSNGFNWFSIIDSRQQRILYFSGSMHACRNIHETRRVGLYIKGVSHGFVQMVYYCLDLFLISLQSCLLHFSCEVLLMHVIPALSFIALLSDAMKCLVSVHLTRADF